MSTGSSVFLTALCPREVRKLVSFHCSVNGEEDAAFQCSIVRSATSEGERKEVEGCYTTRTISKHTPTCELYSTRYLDDSL